MRINGRAGRALAAAAALLVLVGCGGGGGSNGSPNPGSGGSTSTDGYVLFATDIVGGFITAFRTADPPAGQLLAGHVVEHSDGGATIAYDAVHDDLYAVHAYASQEDVIIDVFAHASQMSDDAAPSRSILVTGYVVPFATAIAFDAARNELWLGGLTGNGGNNGGRLTVFANASSLSGAAAPTRDIQGLPDFSTFAVDTTHDMLYLAGGGGVMHGVYAFANASALTSSTAATTSRAIEGVDGVSTYLITVDDQRDVLYVPSPSGGLGIVHGASTATPTVTTLRFAPDASCCTTAAIDSKNDRLFVGAYANAYVLDSASKATAATVTPAAAVTSPGASIFSFAFP